MKFRIEWASRKHRTAENPPENLPGLTSVWNDRMKALQWFVEVNTLKELMQIVEDHGEIVIEKLDETPCIIVYDYYLE